MHVFNHLALFFILRVYLPELYINISLILEVHTNFECIKLSKRCIKNKFYELDNIKIYKK